MDPVGLPNQTHRAWSMESAANIIQGHSTNIPSRDQNGYPLYEREDDNVTFCRSGHEFTNRDVIPYNPWLSAKYGAHINVEIATSVTSVKYLYKYVYKGHDRATISVERDIDDPVDEINEYLDARYVSAAEACWLIFSFSMHQLHPSVIRLHLHLEGQHMVAYNPYAETTDQVLARSATETTTLTAFYEACRQYPDLTSDLLYPDLPSRFRWDNEAKRRVRRLSGISVGRVFFCPPSVGEKFYLRMLLYNVPGPTSYVYLKIYNGDRYETFQEACAARGLLESDQEWDICLAEAAEIKTGRQLRRLFVTILIQNSPNDPRALFNRHLLTLTDDSKYRLQHRFGINNPSDDQIHSLALQDIEDDLLRAGKALSDYHLPNPTVAFTNLEGVSRVVAEETDYDTNWLHGLWQQGYGSANPEQKAIFDTVTAAVESGNGGLFFIDGPGGTGKTFVENVLLAYVRSRRHVALAVASSGIASILLEGGRTSHSRFKIPIDINSESICSIGAQTELAKLLSMTKLIVWDEAPAQNRHCFEAVDRTLKDILGNTNCFGGITVVYSGLHSALHISNFQVTSDNACL
jgi:hypothetical protein